MYHKSHEKCSQKTNIKSWPVIGGGGGYHVWMIAEGYQQVVKDASYMNNTLNQSQSTIESRDTVSTNQRKEMLDIHMNITSL